jgi:uncharacterized protein (DUF1015 family)
MPTWSLYSLHTGQFLKLDEIVASYTTANEPVYDFTASDGVGHHFWVISDRGLISEIVSLFGKVPFTYVADGHHRTAAAAIVGSEKESS